MCKSPEARGCIIFKKQHVSGLSRVWAKKRKMGVVSGDRE